MGTIAVTNIDSRVVGSQRVSTGTGTMSASYANPGGDTFPLGSIGLGRLDRLNIVNHGLGVLCRWDGSTTAPKVQAYRDVTPAATAAFAEVANGQSLSATGIFTFEAWGG